MASYRRRLLYEAGHVEKVIRRMLRRAVARALARDDRDEERRILYGDGSTPRLGCMWGREG